MGEYKEFTGKTVEEAITDACSSLLVTSDELDYIVIRQPAQGFLGIGSKDALIRARKKQDGADADAGDDDYSEDFDETKADTDTGSEEFADDEAPVSSADEPEEVLKPISETDISVDPGVNFLKDVLKEMVENKEL